MAEKRIALIVASYQYEDAGLRQLVAPPQDAADLARVLGDLAIGNFEVQTLLNEPSYRVSQSIEAFFADRKREDLLLLYFSGHGIKDQDGQLYFATANTRRNLLRSTAVPADLVNMVMFNSRSRRQVLLLDCCYSGAFARGLMARAGPDVGTRERFQGRGRVVLTASDAMQYSFEGDIVEGQGVRSVFTRTLLRGLETGEADRDADGRITLDELYDYVYDRVIDETPEQRPGKWEFDVQGEITVARSPRRVMKPVELGLVTQPSPESFAGHELPPELLQAIDDPSAIVREDAVRQFSVMLRSGDEAIVQAAHSALKRLAEDDSRRVATLATMVLTSYLETQNLSWIGYTFGRRYKIEALLGQGGMSVVYKGTDPNLQRTVAIKLIHPHLSSDPDFVRRFEQEAAAVARLRHPNIVQVFDFNHEGNLYYMVLEYLTGETLQARLETLRAANQLLPLAETIRIMSTICDAVAFAHRHDMVHRDLKPANVMLDAHAQPTLMDFGVAKMLGGKHHTAVGAVVGTVTYMSPEQIRGDDVDGRADIYSLGVILFEMIAGQPPFEGDSTASVLLKHLNEPVPDIHQFNSGVIGLLDAVVDKALEKDPANRFQTVVEMAAALRAIDLRAPPSREADRSVRQTAQEQTPREAERRVAPKTEVVKPAWLIEAQEQAKAESLAMQRTREEQAAREKTEREERRARDRAEQERLARETERAEAERLAALAKQAEAERQTREQAEQARLAHEKAEADRRRRRRLKLGFVLGGLIVLGAIITWAVSSGTFAALFNPATPTSAARPTAKPTVRPTSKPTSIPVATLTPTRAPTWTRTPTRTRTRTPTPRPATTTAPTQVPVTRAPTNTPTPAVSAPQITGAFEVGGDSHTSNVRVSYAGLDAGFRYTLIAYSEDYCPPTESCNAWNKYPVHSVSGGIIEPGASAGATDIRVAVDNVYCQQSPRPGTTNTLSFELRDSSGRYIEGTYTRYRIPHPWC